MNPTSRRMAWPLAVLLLSSPLALARDVEGVKTPDTVTAGDKTLKLNGAGLRIKKVAFVKAKVYVGALYLEASSKDAGAILAADSARAIRLQFMRNVGKDKMVEAFREGWDANAGAKAAPQKASFDKLLAWLPDVKEGEFWLFTYVPGKGTTVNVGGKDVGTLESKDFADALFSIWLGPKPPTEDLKAAMLQG